MSGTIPDMLCEVLDSLLATAATYANAGPLEASPVKQAVEHVKRVVNIHDELVAMLERLEWRPFANEDFDGDICSLCGGISHKPDCALAALIRRAKSLTGQ